MYKYAISVNDEQVLRPSWQKAVRASKLKRIELSCVEQITKETLNKELAVLTALQDEGVAEVGSVHIPFGDEWNPAALDENDRRKFTARIIDFIRTCKPLNTKNFTIHGSYEPVKDADRQAALAALHRTLEDLLPVMEEADAFINVEILPRSCLANNAEELAGIVSGFPERIGVCFDVNHLCGCPEAVPPSIKLLKDRIRTLHLSDYDGIDECHWYPGIGIIDWTKVMDEIKSLPNDVLLIFESQGFVHVSPMRGSEKDPAFEFHNAERNIFFLENCREIIRRISEMTVK